MYTKQFGVTISRLYAFWSYFMYRVLQDIQTKPYKMSFTKFSTTASETKFPLEHY